MDLKGYVTITDRKKDMILVSGFHVYPNEIESILMAHPGIEECATIGIPDEKSGEAVEPRFSISLNRENRVARI